MTFGYTILRQIINFPFCEILKDTGLKATKVFYDEIAKYDFNNPVLTNDNYRFTQIVWRNTTQVGFGFTYSKNTINNNTYNCIWIVARYRPNGNNEATLSINVLPPIGYPDWEKVVG
jgi:hypothetical protein